MGQQFSINSSNPRVILNKYVNINDISICEMCGQKILKLKICNLCKEKLIRKRLKNIGFI